MDKLGIEPTLLGAQVINFLVILFVLKKFLYKPILDMIDKRKREIARGLDLTEAMKAEEAKINERKEKAFEKAKEEALVIIESAKKQAKEVEKELIADAHTQASHIITRAKEEAKEIENEAQLQLRKEAVRLALTMSRRVLSSVMSVKDQHAFIAKQTKDLDAWAQKLAEK